MAHNTSCVSANVMTELNETYANLKKESIKDLAADLPWYMRKASELRHMIETCSTK